MERFTLVAVTIVMQFGVICSQHTHWMARSIFDIQAVNFNKDLIMANLTLEDVFDFVAYPTFVGVSGNIEFKEDLKDDYEVSCIFSKHISFTLNFTD